jgi:hypothetical protein
VTTNKVLKVFLASPNDVEQERERAETLIADLNRSISVAGLSVELLKWEQRSPAFGRPQDQINAMVDECDIFLGLLWKRWGTPTGNFTSGFEEEFHRATERRKRGDRPEIWLVFKNVSRDLLNDPGEELRKVIEFKKRQEVLNQVLFKKVTTTRDWEIN